MLDHKGGFRLVGEPGCRIVAGARRSRVIHRPQERRIQAPLSITKAFRVFCGDGASLQGLIKVDGTFA